MRTACCQDGAVSLKGLTSNHHYTVTQLSLEALVVELLENMLEVTWKVHHGQWSWFLNTKDIRLSSRIHRAGRSIRNRSYHLIRCEQPLGAQLQCLAALLSDSPAFLEMFWSMGGPGPTVTRRNAKDPACAQLMLSSPKRTSNCRRDHPYAVGKPHSSHTIARFSVHC